MRRVYWVPVDKTIGVVCDETLQFNRHDRVKNYVEKLHAGDGLETFLEQFDSAAPAQPSPCRKKASGLCALRNERALRR